MKLTAFRVRNYRSVNDSGWIRVSERTALVGRNESGKTNLLMALANLNPAQGMSELSFIKDYPRDREVDDFSPDLTVLDTTWRLDSDERAALAEIIPALADIEQVRVGRSYAPTCYVGFELPKTNKANVQLARHEVSRLRQSINASARQRIDGGYSDSVILAARAMSEAVDSELASFEWAVNLSDAIDLFDQAVEADRTILPSVAEDALKRLKADFSLGDIMADAHQRAMEWVIEHLPVMIYLSDIPDLDGHHNLADFRQRIDAGRPTQADISLQRLSEVAGFDPLELTEDRPDQRERRQHVIHRAGARLTQAIRDVWTDRPIRIRFNLDGDHLDTLVSDPTSKYDMEVNLNERSRGFRWFLSLYVLLASDPATLHGENVMLLLDEPGLHLHALGQRDLLEHLSSGFDSQIIYVTHSPFMIPVEDLSSVRTVNYNSEDGTTCSDKPKGDARTLYPIQVAMAYASDEGLFGDQPLLLVGQLSDYLILGAMSSYFASRERPGLPDDCAVIPMSGLDRAVYMLASFGEDTEGVLLLVNDAEPRWEKLRELMDDSSPCLSVSEFAPKSLSRAALEDLIDPESYRQLILEVYAREIGEREIATPPAGSSVISHYAEAISDCGGALDRNRVAAMFMGKLTAEPDKFVNRKTRDRFARLFSEIQHRLIG